MFGDNDSYIKKIKDRHRWWFGSCEINGVPIEQIELKIKQYENEDIGYVNLFYLVAEYRGQGFVTKLIDYAESFFLENKVS